LHSAGIDKSNEKLIISIKKLKNLVSFFRSRFLFYQKIKKEFSLWLGESKTRRSYTLC
jgi:hypothetical protein